MDKRLYFFIGTTAEFLKVMPVMRELSARGIDYKIISSGQNKLSLQDTLQLSGARGIDFELSSRPVRKCAIGLISWFVRTFLRALVILRKELGAAGGTLIVHGDTISTVMGGLIGKIFGMRVAHIEAGLRSFNFFQPFPEEIDRYVTSHLADIHFCPLDSAVRNLAKRRGIKINTLFNTSVDSLALALASDNKAKPDAHTSDPYFILVMHRQENLLDRRRAESILRAVLDEAHGIRCIFVMHDLTRATLNGSALLAEIETRSDITVVNRMPFLEFVSLFKGCEYIVTDGGGNQQESYYLGKPCLLLRNVTEGGEGLGHNVVLWKNDKDVLRQFVSQYKSYARPMILPEKRPSEIIVEALLTA